MASEASWNPGLWTAAGGQMPEGWRLIPFGDLLESPKSISVGVMYPGAGVTNGIPLIRVGDVGEGGVVGTPAMRISSEVHNEYRRTELRGDELLITLVGKPGVCVIARPNMRGWNVARALAAARLQDPSLRPYLKAVLESSVMKNIILSMLNTTVQPTLNLKEIKNLPVPMPGNLNLAFSIGDMAELFNERIALLRSINTTLESIAQAIFKSWFIDFDPVRAKAEGREPEGMDAATAALFPAKFEDSALGLIPRGWRLGTLADFVTLNAESWTSKRRPSRLDYVDLSNVKDNRLDEITEYEFDDAPSRARRVLRSGDTIIGTVRPGNRSFAYIEIAPTGLTGSTGFAVLSPKDDWTREFVYLTATRDENIERLANLADGGAYPAVRPELVVGTQVVIPVSQVLEAFSAITAPLFSKQTENRCMERSLSEIRDALLPRLISGKLPIPEAQEQLEDALA